MFPHYLLFTYNFFVIVFYLQSWAKYVTKKKNQAKLDHTRKLFL